MEANLQTLLSAAGSLIGILVLLYLRTLKQDINKLNTRIDAQDTRIETIQDRMRSTYVDKVDFIRNVNKQERTLEKLVAMINKLDGSMKFVEQVPQICGNIAKEIVKEFKP